MKDSKLVAKAFLLLAAIASPYAMAANKAFTADIKVSHIPETMQFAVPENLYADGTQYYPAYYVIVDQLSLDFSQAVRITLNENCDVTDCLSGAAKSLAPETGLYCEAFTIDFSGGGTPQSWPCTFTINDARDTFHIVGSAIADPSLLGDELELLAAINYTLRIVETTDPATGTHGACPIRRRDVIDLTSATDVPEISATSPAGDVGVAGAACDPATAPPPGNLTMDAATDILEFRLAFSEQPASPIVLRQHGLSGTWYNPDTSGQGFLFEEYPTVDQVFIGWFTYGNRPSDGAIGQRWYALQGATPADATQADLVIYAGYDGNFAAPPSIAAGPVGLATLRVASCSSGALDYFFYDGRQGTVLLTRLLDNVSCTATGESVPEPAQYLLSGNWYDAAASGQGMQFEFNTSRHELFGAWYTYGTPESPDDSTTSQRWYSFQLGGIDASQTVFGGVPLFVTAGGTFDAPGETATTQVGSVDITFQSCTAATFAYSFTSGEHAGESGSIALTRVGPTPEGCSL